MSKHGEKEKKCIEEIQNNIFISKPLNGKTFWEITDEEFEKYRELFINSSVTEHYFGMSEDDCFLFETLLRSANPNPEPSQFPDFITKDGFIEHFQITSSITTKKGATHKKNYQNFIDNMNKEMQIFQDEMDNNPAFDIPKEQNWVFPYPAHSYDNLDFSFKASWEKHISSLKKYNGNKNIGIFLIDYPEMVLKTHIDFKVKAEHYYGDLLFREKNPWYRLSRDKKLLNYVYECCNLIKYVIFKTFNTYEIINVSNIPELLKLLPWEYTVAACSMVCEQHALYGISVPNQSETKDIANEQT